MRTTVSLAAIVCSLHLAVGAWAAERVPINRHTGLFEPPVSDLRRASERGDRAELARVATRLGAARLSRLLADPDRKTLLAALDAAPLVEGGVLLLETVAPLLASSDGPVRARAVAATAALFAQSGPMLLGEYEVAPETVSAACHALAALAASDGEPMGTRISAIQAVMDTGSACRDHLKLGVLLASREPEIRRAAVLAVPEVAAGSARGPLATAVKDTDARVAGAAAARLCRLLGPRQAILPPLHDLALAGEVPAEDVVDLLPCLAASGDAADQKALTQLQQGGRAVLRDALKRLRETRQATPSSAGGSDR
jgi:hypothetical protein